MIERMGDTPEDYEETLLMLDECFVYKIPPRTAAAGYKYVNCALKGLRITSL